MAGRRQSLSWMELRVGVLVITSFALLAVAIFFVGGETGFFTPTYTVTAYFESANGMNRGAEVRMEGVTVGSVESIQVTDETEPERAVAIVLKIDERYPIRTDSVLTIGTIGLLGDSIVEITRGQADGEIIADGGTVQGDSGGDIREIIQGTNDVIANLEALSEQVNEIAGQIAEGEGTLGRILTDDSIYESLRSTTEEAYLLVNDARTGGGTIGRFMADSAVYDRTVAMMERMDAIVEAIEAGQGTAGRFIYDPALYDRASALIATMEGIVDRVESGEGTLGRILTDESLFDNLNDATEGISTMVSNVTNSEGTAGKLINDSALYDNFNQTISEMLKLMYDFRQDPGKFLTINFRLF